MDIAAIAVKELEALGQILLVGLLLGVGLPALFALGIKSLNTGRTGVAAGRDGEVSKASPVGLAGAAICFAVCVLAVAFGIVVIIWGKHLFGA
jgi:hypothetical protein